MSRLRALGIALWRRRGDLLAWSGVVLLAVALAQLHPALGLALVGLALIIDGIAGGHSE